MSSRLVIALVVAACGKHEPAPATPDKPADKPAGKRLDCKAAADEVGKFLTTMDHESQRIDLRHVSLPTRSDLTIRESELTNGPVLEIHPDATMFQGTAVAPAALAAKLTEAHDKVQQDIDSGRIPKRYNVDAQYLIIVADEKAPWSTVVSALEAAAKAKLDHVTFVFRRPPATPPPPRTHVDDEMEKAMAAPEAAGDKAGAIAKYLSPKVALCPPLAEIFGKLGSEEMDDKAGYLLGHTAAALAACNCALDPAEARSMLWQFLGNPTPSALLRVELARKARPITAPANQTWGEASSKLTADTKTAWLTAAPAQR